MRLACLLALAAGLPALDGAPAPIAHGLLPYEPVWFVVDPGWTTERPVTAKFQISLATRLVGPPGAEAAPGDLRADGLYAAYSQTSLWDLSSLSKPFIDSSYRPEAWWHQHLAATEAWGVDAVEGGFGHESNGKGGADSRSLNRVFARVLGHWNLGEKLLLRASPRAGAYVGDLGDNPDIARYRGHADLEAGIGDPAGWWLNLRGRIGDEWDRGSLQADLDYPLDRLSSGWVHGYAHIQGFWGWSESLLAYDQQVEQPRILVGFAILH